MANAAVVLLLLDQPVPLVETTVAPARTAKRSPDTNADPLGPLSTALALVEASPPSARARATAPTPSTDPLSPFFGSRALADTPVSQMRARGAGPIATPDPLPTVLLSRWWVDAASPPPRALRIDRTAIDVVLPAQIFPPPPPDLAPTIRPAPRRADVAADVLRGPLGWAPPVETPPAPVRRQSAPPAQDALPSSAAAPLTAWAPELAPPRPAPRARFPSPDALPLPAPLLSVFGYEPAPAVLRAIPRSPAGSSEAIPGVRAVMVDPTPPAVARAARARGENPPDVLPVLPTVAVSPWAFQIDPISQRPAPGHRRAEPPIVLPAVAAAALTPWAPPPVEQRGRPRAQPEAPPFAVWPSAAAWWQESQPVPLASPPRRGAAPAEVIVASRVATGFESAEAAARRDPRRGPAASDVLPLGALGTPGGFEAPIVVGRVAPQRSPAIFDPTPAAAALGPAGFDNPTAFARAPARAPAPASAPIVSAQVRAWAPELPPQAGRLSAPPRPTPDPVALGGRPTTGGFEQPAPILLRSPRRAPDVSTPPMPKLIPLQPYGWELPWPVAKWFSRARAETGGVWFARILLPTPVAIVGQRTQSGGGPASSTHSGGAGGQTNSGGGGGPTRSGGSGGPTHSG